MRRIQRPGGEVEEGHRGGLPSLCPGPFRLLRKAVSGTKFANSFFPSSLSSEALGLLPTVIIDAPATENHGHAGAMRLGSNRNWLVLDVTTGATNRLTKALLTTDRSYFSWFTYMLDCRLLETSSSHGNFQEVARLPCQHTERCLTWVTGNDQLVGMAGLGQGLH